MTAKTAIERISNLVQGCQVGSRKIPEDIEVACDLLETQDEALTKIYRICWEVE